MQGISLPHTEQRRAYLPQASACKLMSSAAIRTEEAPGILNSGIDLGNKVLRLQRGVKKYRDALESTPPAAGIERKGLRSTRHTFATSLVNGIRQPDDTIKSLTPRQVADLLGHSASEITEFYYVRKDTARLSRITEGLEL